MKKIVTGAVLALSVTAMTVPPVLANAAPHRYRVWVCKNPRRAANNGTIVGGLGGAVLGSAVAGHGAKTEGAVLGAGLGALAGHQIAKKQAKRDCHYEYRYRR